MADSLPTGDRDELGHEKSFARRRWIYRVTLAALPILTAIGWIGEADAPLYVALAGAVFGVGTAVYNT